MFYILCLKAHWKILKRYTFLSCHIKSCIFSHLRTLNCMTGNTGVYLYIKLRNPSVIIIIMLRRRMTTTQTKPAICNILMAELIKRIYNHLLRNNILPEEQKGCCRMSRVSKDQLLLSKMIISLAKKHQRHLCIAWID